MILLLLMLLSSVWVAQIEEGERWLERRSFRSLTLRVGDKIAIHVATILAGFG